MCGVLCTVCTVVCILSVLRTRPNTGVSSPSSSPPLPFRYARWTAKRDRQMVKKYKDEEGITLELDGLGAREIKAAIIKRDEKETEEALSELVSHRNVAVVLVKPPLSGDARTS